MSEYEKAKELHAKILHVASVHQAAKDRWEEIYTLLADISGEILELHEALIKGSELTIKSASIRPERKKKPSAKTP